MNPQFQLVSTNLGGDTDAYKYHSIKESNNFGGRAEISYLKGSVLLNLDLTQGSV